MGFFASSGILNRRGFFSAPVAAAPPAPSGIVFSTTSNVTVNYATYPYTLAKQGTFTNNNSETVVGGGQHNITATVSLSYVNGKYYYYTQGNYQYVVGLIGPSGASESDSEGGGLQGFNSGTYLWAVIVNTSGNYGLLDFSYIYPVTDETIIPTTGWALTYLNNDTVTITAA